MINQVRDTFIKALSDNLPGIKFNVVRSTNSNPTSIVQQLNAVNVEFLGVNFQFTGTCQVSIDIMYDDETQCIGVAEEIWNLFKNSFWLPLYDYSNPASPVVIPQKYISFEQMYFRKINRSEYAHYNCILELKFLL